MTRSSPRPLAIALAVVGLAPAGIVAQSIPSPYEYIERSQEAGLLGGYVSAETGRFGLAPDGGLLIGGRYGVELTGPLSLEGHVGTVSGTRDIINPARLEGDQLVGQGDVTLVTLDARLRFSFVGRRTWHGLNPFLTFGGGVVFDVASAPEVESTLEPEDVFDFGTSFLGTAGAGTRWFLTERIALRADGVFSLWQVDTPPGFSDPSRGFENVEESEWMSGLSFSVTLLYRW